MSSLRLGSQCSTFKSISSPTSCRRLMWKREKAVNAYADFVAVLFAAAISSFGASAVNVNDTLEIGHINPKLRAL
ncbi:hypothetical protein [Rhizobium sp. R635]|uniref:hypothetical protein n=1 Tax=Rhizobium sp. R635 TaxID=1764275 RepID=UPI001AECF665|nr:hypothetical protein [Rhizobium sp. R635]